MKNLYLLVTAVIVFLNPATSQIVNSNFKPTIEGLPELYVAKNLENDKVLIAGQFTSIQDVNIRGAALLNSDGSLDTDFSLSIISSGTIYDALFDPQIEKYYFSGIFEDRNDVIRLNADGIIDDTFQPNIEFFVVNHIGLQSDGKLIVISSTENMGLARLNTDGSLDETFSNSAGFNEISYLESDLKILSDDNILFGGGFTSFNNEAKEHLIKLNSDGTIDERFAFNGALTAQSTPNINSVLPLSNGDIVLAGNFDSIYGVPVKSLAKISSDGSLEPSFTVPGSFAGLFNQSIRAILDQDEQILVSGIDPLIKNYQLIKLNIEGTFDNNFTVGTIELNNSLGFILEPFLSTSSDNSIYYSSFHTIYDGHFSQGLSKINSSGNVITSFNADIAGKAEISITKEMNDGSLLFGGTFTAINNQPMNYFAKLLSNGLVDAQFMESVGTGPDQNVNAIAIDNNGNILIGGSFTNFNNQSTGFVIGLSSDGLRNENFDPQVFSNTSGSGVNDIQVIENNQILIGGRFDFVDNQSKSGGIAKLNADGSLDGTYDLSLSDAATINDIDLLSDGSILYSGNIGFTEGAILGKSDLMGNASSNFDISYDFTDIEILNTTVIPATGVILVSTIRSGSSNYGLIQFESDGTLKDENAISSAGTFGVSTIFPLDSENILIGGQFVSVNDVSSPGFAKVSLTGAVDTEINYNLVEIGNFTGPAISSILDLGESNYLISGNFSKIEGLDVTSTAIVNLNVPKPPTNLTGVFSFTDGVTLSWEDNSSKETNYVVYRKSTNGEFELIADLPPNRISFVDSDVILTNGYSYRVRALNGDLSSDYSSQISVDIPSLDVPTEILNEFNFTFGTTLTWQDNSDSEESITIYRADEGDEFEVLKELTASQLSYNDSTVELNTSYQYFLKLTAGIFESFSDTVTFITPESALLPTPEIGFAILDNMIVLDWQYDITQILGFEIYRSPETNDTFELIASTEENEYTDISALQNIPYFYKIKAFNAFESSEFSNEVTLLITAINGEDTASFKIYPNPATTDLKITSEFMGSTFEVLDFNGKVLNQGNINHEKVDVSQLRNGIYLIKIYYEGKELTQKLLIER